MKALETQHGLQLENQHEILCQNPIPMFLSCWSLRHSPSLNWSLTKMSWNWNFVNVDTEKEISSDYVRLENKMHVLLENEMCMLLENKMCIG